MKRSLYKVYWNNKKVHTNEVFNTSQEALCFLERDKINGNHINSMELLCKC